MKIIVLLFSLVVLLFSIIIHECAHGLAAERRGDPTARMEGRITLNPIPHLDPIGSILLPGIMIFMSLFGAPLFIFGWAKPVPINPYNLNDPKRDMIWVGLAGCAANFGIALVLSLLARILITGPLSLAAVVLFYGVSINLILAFFNLIPIPPLDGSHILRNILPPEAARKYDRIQPYGFIILLAAIYFNLLAIFFLPAQILYAGLMKMVLILASLII